MSPFRLALICCLTLCAFAANSLLCRGALGSGQAGAASFTAVRLLSGAAVLWLLTRLLRPARSAPTNAGWASATALLLYAAPFSWAYLRIGAGVGALLLFGAVQLTMFVVALVRGERPPPRVWAGLVLAFCGLTTLTLPGAQAPDPAAAAAMLGAGASWGWYSLRGRRAKDGLSATADAFVRAGPVAGALWGLAALASPAAAQLSGRGALLALASGALASGLGYTLWNTALPHLSAARAAVIQIATPAITAVAAVVLLGEHVTTRLLIGGAAILAGVTLAVLGRLVRTAAPLPGVTLSR
ncbi:MAG TPA: DMT family transporter [Myxococcales bacterium]|nr:DMT family transporter [Myxococcales bacterium]